MFQKRKPTRNQDYLSWVKQQPCVACGHPVSDAHHVKGYGLSGMGAKASDLTAFPLCRTCHSDLHDNGWRFWERGHGSQWLFVQGTLMRALREGVL